MLNFFFPQECLICSKIGSLLCEKCKKQIIPTLPNCYICKKLSNDFLTHKNCFEINCYKKVITFFKYNKCSKKLIYNFKYKNRYKVADFIFSLFKSKLKQEDFADSLLVPIPSYKGKILERGFNPTQIICELISNKVNASYNSNLLFKKNANLSQASLTYEKREENVKNVFEINVKELENIKKYRNIIIIDDITTTGATLNAISEIIQQYHKTDIAIMSICIFQGNFKKQRLITIP